MNIQKTGIPEPIRSALDVIEDCLDIRAVEWNSSMEHPYYQIRTSFERLVAGLTKLHFRSLKQLPECATQMKVIETIETGSD
jgi:hypothetical protein